MVRRKHKLPPLDRGTQQQLHQDRQCAADFSLNMLNVLKEKGGKSARLNALELLHSALREGYESPPELL
jgi:hypothetical protein